MLSKKSLVLIFLIFVMLSVAIVYFFNQNKNSDQEESKILATLTEYLKSEDLNRSFELLSKRDRNKLDRNEWSKQIAEENRNLGKLTSIQIINNKIIIQGNLAKLEFKAKFENAEFPPVEKYFVKENNEWKVLESPNPNEIQLTSKDR